MILEAREAGAAGVVGGNGEIKTPMLNSLAFNFEVESIKLRISKPGALRGAKDVGIKIER